MGNEAKPVTPLKDRMFVVLTGPDCAGKSTLAAGLSEHFDVKLEANSRIKERRAIVPTLLATLKSKDPKLTGRGVLFDRWPFPCDIVYERVHGRETSVIWDHLTTLNKAFKKVDGLFIHVYAQPDELLRRYEKRGDEFVTGEQIVQSAKEYKKFFESQMTSVRLRLPQRGIDTTNKTPEEVLAEAIRVITGYYGMGHKA